MDSSPSPRRSRARTSAIAVRSQAPDSPPPRHPARPSRVPGSNRERSVPPPPKTSSIPRSPPTRARQSTYGAPSLQVFVDPPPPPPTPAAQDSQTPKKVKRRATAQGSIVSARKSLPNPDTLASPKITGRPVSDASPTTSSIARPVRMGRASLPLIQVQAQARERDGVVSPPPVTRLPPIPTSPPIPLSPPVGPALDFLTFTSGRESVTAIASTLQIPTSPPLEPGVEIQVQVQEEWHEGVVEGPTMTSDEVLARIDSEIAFDTKALEKINEGIARIYELKVELRRAVRMSRTM